DGIRDDLVTGVQTCALPICLARYNIPTDAVGCAMKRLREFFESIVFAGMNRGARPRPAPGTKGLGRLRGALERLLSGSAPTDPRSEERRVGKARSYAMAAYQ